MADGSGCGGFARLFSGMPGADVVPHLLRLVAQGSPVTVEDLAAAAELPAGEVERALRSQPGTDWDGHGRVVGFGLTLRPTAHRYTVAGRALHTFCATDVLLFTHVLGVPAVAESTCPVTARAIRIELTPAAVLSVDPPGTVVTQVALDAGLARDIRRNVCDQGLFFATRTAAREWAGEHPNGDVLTVADAFEQSRLDIEKLGWLPHHPVTP